MDIFIARQPIFGLNGALFGYEFLYRGSARNQYDPGMDGNVATRSLLSDLITEFRVDVLTGGTHAFVNFTQELLETDCPYLFEPVDFVIEILENVQSHPLLLERLKKMKEKGYILALDDYTGDPLRETFTELADIIKVDFRLTTRQKQKQIAGRFSGKKKLLAEKIETEAELNFARKNGYSLFQGYYFSRPVMLTRKAAELAGATYVRLWKEIHRQEPDFDVLSQIIQSDVSLSYKLLARANTMSFYCGHEIQTVRESLVHMGLSEIKRWSLSVLMRDLTGDRGDEPAKCSLTRALFSQSLAGAAGMENQAENAYMAGLFSILELIYGSGLEELLRNLNLPQTVRDALLNGEGILGEMLRFVRNYEIGNWQAVPEFLHRHGLENCGLPERYLYAVEQAELFFGTEKRWVKTHPY